jgi:hypothetical protein
MLTRACSGNVFGRYLNLTLFRLLAVLPEITVLGYDTKESSKMYRFFRGTNTSDGDRNFL